MLFYVSTMPFKPHLNVSKIPNSKPPETDLNLPPEPRQPQAQKHQSSSPTLYPPSSQLSQKPTQIYYPRLSTRRLEQLPQQLRIQNERGLDRLLRALFELCDREHDLLRRRLHRATLLVLLGQGDVRKGLVLDLRGGLLFGMIEVI